MTYTMKVGGKGIKHSPIILHLVLQFHDLDFHPPLSLMFQDPLVGLSMYRRPCYLFQIIRVVGLLAPERRWSLTDLEVGGVTCNIPICPSARVSALVRDKAQI